MLAPDPIPSRNLAVIVSFLSHCAVSGESSSSSSPPFLRSVASLSLTTVGLGEVVVAQVVRSESAAFLERVASFIISRLSSSVLLKLIRTCLFLICSRFWIWICDREMAGVGVVGGAGAVAVAAIWLYVRTWVMVFWVDSSIARVWSSIFFWIPSVISLKGTVSCSLIVFATSCVVSVLIVSRMCLTSELATSCVTLSSSCSVSRKATAVIAFAVLVGIFCSSTVANSVRARVSSEIASPAITHPLVWR